MQKWRERARLFLISVTTSGTSERHVPSPALIPAMLPVITLLGVAITATAVGIALGMIVQKRRGTARPSAAAVRDVTEVTSASNLATVGFLRSQALEVAAEPVLIVGSDGRLRDCNAAALLLLARHRTEVTEVEASSVRTLVRGDGARQEWTELVVGRAPWSGDAHVRLPDGSRSVVQARLVPVFGDGGHVMAMVEVYASSSASSSSSSSVGKFPQALEGGDVGDDGVPPLEGARRELGLLAMAFADVETVLRQYERLLPAMRAEDPLTEAMAGLAAETSEVAASADVPRLLAEIPRALARLHTRLEQHGHLGAKPPD